MRPTVRRVLALTAIAVAAAPAAAATEEKSTKPRIAVIEFKNEADTRLDIQSVQWGAWIADVERPQAGKQPKSRPMVLAPGGTRPRPAAAPETGDEVLVAMEHGDPGSGQATGKRQHKPVLSDAAGGVEGPITITKEWDAATPQIMKLDRPAPRGSVMLRLAQPWAGCAVGDRFNGVYLTSGVTHKYRLDGAEIVGCGGSTVTINYTKFASVGEPVR